MTDQDPSSEPEFGSMATWTVEAVDALGDDHALPAACRGSGGPGALDWFAGHLGLRRGQRLVDIGAGVGGPAAWARSQHGVDPLLLEPMTAACLASTRLFSVPAAAATAEHLPLPDRSVDVAWSLGVLCTTSDQPASLGEIARVLSPGGRCGLLVYVRTRPDLDREPEVNHFPGIDELAGMVAGAGLEVAVRTTLDDLPDPPDEWRAREDAVDAWIEDAHGHTDEWQEAHDDEDAVADLLRTGQVEGRLLVVTRTEP